MKETFQYHKSILNIMVFALVVLLSILTAQTSAMAENYAPVPMTGQTESYALGDDGDLQIGVQWPDPRFTDNGDGTVTYNLTSLIWLKNADCFGTKNWYDALDDCNDLEDGVCGLRDGSSSGDWRLPNIRELYSLMDYRKIDPPLPSGHPFTVVQPSFYWSSTTYANATDSAWLVYMFNGEVRGYYKGYSHITYVWPVRGRDDENQSPLEYKLKGKCKGGQWSLDVSANGNYIGSFLCKEGKPNEIDELIMLPSGYGVVFLSAEGPDDRECSSAFKYEQDLDKVKLECKEGSKHDRVEAKFEIK